MKKAIFFLLSVILLVSCKQDEPKAFIVDPMATVNLKPQATAWNSKAMKVKSSVEYLSSAEIVKQTTVIHFTTILYGKPASATRMFDPAQRDTVSAIPMLKMWGTDIIKEDGTIEVGFIEAKDLVLEIWHGWDKGLPFSECKIDTIAYIPNSVLRAAETAIKQAYNANDNETVYRLFNEAFTFRPTTGSEYKALKLQGLN